MIRVAVELLAAFSKLPEHGANAIAATLPRAKFGGGQWPAPRPMKIFDDVNDAEIAAALDPKEVPCLMFWGDSQTDAPATKLYRVAKNVTIACAYVTDSGESPERANSESGLVLRAEALSLHRYNHQENSKGYRELNGIRVFEVTSVAQQDVTATVGRRKMWGFLEIRAIVGETLS